jgi:hypothetical protein
VLVGDIMAKFEIYFPLLLLFVMALFAAPFGIGDTADLPTKAVVSPGCWERMDRVARRI